MSLLHSGGAYSVHEASPDTPRIGVVIVTFANWEAPEAPRKPFGAGFLSSLGYRSLHIVPACNDWYQSEGIFEAIDAVRARIGADTAIGYGSSMGAFGLVNYADLLGLDAALAFSPQFSIDRAVVPFEWRWKADAERLSPFPFHRLHARVQRERLTIYVDPTLRADREHAALISECLSCTVVECEGGGHNILASWHAAGTLRERVAEALEKISRAKNPSPKR